MWGENGKRREAKGETRRFERKKWKLLRDEELVRGVGEEKKRERECEPLVGIMRDKRGSNELIQVRDGLKEASGSRLRLFFYWSYFVAVTTGAKDA